MIRYRGQLRGSQSRVVSDIWVIKKNSHFMIDVLNLKLRFVTDVLTERSGSLSEPGFIFFILI